MLDVNFKICKANIINVCMYDDRFLFKTDSSFQTLNSRLVRE